MNANEAKNHLLRYFRFQRGFPYVATECWNEDIVASDGVRLVCVEVKISWADYRREFTKAKHRKESCHWHRLLPKKRNNPNRLFFAASSELATKIAEDIEKTLPFYGVLSIDSYGQVSVLRKAQKIHDAEVAPRSLHSLVIRLTSELITLWEQVRP